MKKPIAFFLDCAKPTYRPAAELRINYAGKELTSKNSSKTLRSNLPFGELFVEQRSTANYYTPYKFSGKEKDEETSYSYFGARYYLSDISIWASVDPLADDYPYQSPYTYCGWNPVKIIDPDGMGEDDWVKNDKTGKYVWMDNVTSSKNTPNGYRYIGPQNSDILHDLNLPQDLPSINQNRVGFGVDGEEGKGGAVIGSESKTTGSLSIDAVVSINKKNATKNNVSGRKFEGVKFTARFSQSSASGNEDLTMSFNGYLGVPYGDKEYYNYLGPLKETSFCASGTSIAQASVTIPSNRINTTNHFTKAYISAGATNSGLTIHPDPIKMVWNLSKNNVYLSK